MANTIPSKITFGEESEPPTRTNPKPMDDVEGGKKRSVTKNVTVISTPGSARGGTGNDNNGARNERAVVTRKCVGRSNRGVTWGKLSEQGRRESMEDAVAVYPAFMKLSCNEVGGCTAPDCSYALQKSPLHFFGVFDGHGGREVSNYCANELHKMVVEEWERGNDTNGWCKRWEVALCRAYERADDAFKDKSIAPNSVGSTASIVILSACQIIAANCGDSRVVLCRGKQAIPLTVDHKLEREDELARVIKGGGKVVYWGCLRVEAVLNMTRAIGDHSLKPHIISVPEVTFMTRKEDDDFLILASDGLWDVLSNDQVIQLACDELRYRRRQPKTADSSSPPAYKVAEAVLKRAFDAYTSDNISVIVVDLKLPRRRPRQKL